MIVIQTAVVAVLAWAVAADCGAGLHGSLVAAVAAGIGVVTVRALLDAARHDARLYGE